MRWGLMIGMVVEWVALSVWTGGLIVLVSAVLPAVFNTFGGQDSGGLFLTRAFEGYNRLVLGAIAVMAVAMMWRTWYASSPYAVIAAEGWLFAVMVVIAGIIIFYLHPLAAARQAAAFALKAGEGRKEALEAFFQLHMPVRTLYMVNLCLGLALAAVRVRTWIIRTERAL
jgi:hypothetical protein